MIVGRLVSSASTKSIVMESPVCVATASVARMAGAIRWARAAGDVPASSTPSETSETTYRIRCALRVSISTSTRKTAGSTIWAPTCVGVIRKSSRGRGLEPTRRRGAGRGCKGHAVRRRQSNAHEVQRLWPSLRRGMLPRGNGTRPGGMRPNNDTDRRHQVNLALMRLCFGSLAVRLNRRIHGFAPQPRDWFAFVGRETSLTERRARESRRQGPCRACPHANYVIAKGPPAGCPRAADQLLVARASVTDQMLASDGASPRVRQLGRCDGPRRSSSPGRRAAAAS